MIGIISNFGNQFSQIVNELNLHFKIEYFDSTVI